MAKPVTWDEELLQNVYLIGRGEGSIRVLWSATILLFACCLGLALGVSLAIVDYLGVW